MVGNIQFLAKAQGGDTVLIKDEIINEAKSRPRITDTLSVIKEKPQIKGRDSILINIKKEFSPNPNKALLYSAIFPGLGQAYNRKYWKLPIIYGGYLGVIYGITWNGRYYSDYSRAYQELVLNTGTSWTKFTNYSYLEIQRNDALKQQLQSRLKRQKDSFRQNRDLAIIIGVGLYALCMIDAYVDAQLYNFDISPDLSMQVVPVIYGPSVLSNFSVGVQCNITF